MLFLLSREAQPAEDLTSPEPAEDLTPPEPAEDLTPPEPAEDLTPPEPIINDSNDIKTSNYSLIKEWGSRSRSDIQFSHPGDIAVDSLNFVYVIDGYNVQKYNNNGTFITGWETGGWGNRIAIGRSGNVYLADSVNERIQKFDSNGTFITERGSEDNGDGQFDPPGDIAIGSDYVYVAGAYNDRIQKFDKNGTFILEWGGLGNGNGQFNQSDGIAIDSSGHVYVADSDNDRIQKFDENGTFIAKWGSEGNGNGQFNQSKECSYPYHYCNSIAIDSSDYVYVADSGNDRIQKFDKNGTFITKWGSDTPQGIGVDSLGNVYVSYQCTVGPCHIQKFDNNGEFIRNWKEGNPDGQFDWPGGIAIDSSDYVYVTDTGNNRIQKFDNNGTFITKWGSESRRIGEGQFFTPEDVAVDRSGKRVRS